MSAGQQKCPVWGPHNHADCQLVQPVNAKYLQASAKQRKGRAGRVREGKCYSLFTRQAYDTRMQPFQVPEIMRVPLEELVLQIHLLRLGKCEAVMAELLQPPLEKAVAAAVASLTVVGALNAQEVLTPLGKYLVQLPMDARLGKLLVTATFMGCLSSALTIAACLSHSAPFLSSFEVFLQLT
jgi:ATP-dependent RNA helicase DHX29